jgi:gliding motility-associated-like protein
LYSYFTVGNQFLWLGPNAFLSNVQFPILPSASVANNGTYTLTATAANGCTNAAVAQISVTSLPSFSLQNNSPICEQQTLQLSAGPPAYSYTWHTPTVGSSVSPALLINSVQIQHSGTYTVLTTFGPCTSTSLIPVLVHPLPSVNLINTSPVCETGSVVLSALGGNSYTWSGPAGFSTTQSSFTLNNVQMNNAGIYTVVVSDANSCINFAFDTVFVLQNPTPVVMGSSVCIGNTATLNVSGGQSYSWFGPMGFTSSLSTISVFVPNLSYSGQYTVVTSGANSCTVVNLVNLDAFPYPLPVIQITGSPTVCLNSTLNLNASGGTSYLWTGPNSYTTAQQQMILIATSFQNAGVYTLSVLNSNQCLSSTTLEIKIFELPQAELITPLSFGCAPLCCQFDLNPIGTTSEFVYASFYIDGETINGSSTAYCFLNAGIRTIEAHFVDSNSCANTASLSVSVFPKPIAEFRYSPPEPKAGSDEVIFHNASMGDEQKEWTWFFMYPYSDTIPGTTASKVFERSGKYPVAFVVKNTWGCIDTVVKVILVEDDYSIYIPNSFTPNSDGLNDIFQAKGSGFTDYTLEVYDRWGELIFISHDFQTGWDGNYKGQGPKCDVYVWKIHLKTLSGKTKTLTGQVALLR